MASGVEEAAMRRAIELAGRGAGSTLPNPVVGCVLLSPDGVTVGEGWHERAGGPHAEIVALAEARDRARGATAVVTLEPCAHTGRTGPCADALVAAGVQRVVVAVCDPWQPASGGVAKLRAAGVDVETGVLEAAARAGNEPWLVAMARGRPFVTWKFAATLDGRCAAVDGTSRWITGEAARADVHKIRSQVDAVLVGVGTVLADDPMLTVRDAAGRAAPRQPLRVVADTEGRTPAAANVRNSDAATWIATADELGRDADRRLDLSALMAGLHARERRHVLLEGGPRLAGAMIRSALVDRVVAYLAPALLGSGLAALEDAGVRSLGGIHRLALDDVTQLGADIRLTAHVTH